jgi:hypothetical protein
VDKQWQSTVDLIAKRVLAPSVCLLKARKAHLKLWACGPVPKFLPWPRHAGGFSSLVFHLSCGIDLPLQSLFIADDGLICSGLFCITEGLHVTLLDLVVVAQFSIVLIPWYEFI